MSYPETPKYPGAIVQPADQLNAKNLAQGVLQTSISPSDMTIVLNSGQGAKFYADNFVITLDLEIILIASRSGDTLTVATSGRGFEGTTAASHTAGAAVQSFITAKSHNQNAVEIEAIETALGINLGNVVLPGSPLLTNDLTITAAIPKVLLNGTEGSAREWAVLEFAGVFYIQDTTGPLNVFRMDSTGTVGHVGICTVPAGTLDVERLENDSGTILVLGNGVAGNVFNFARSAATGALSLQGLQIGFNDVVLCPTSGKVGIAQAAPAFPLDVTGDVNTSTKYNAGGVAGVSAGPFAAITSIQTTGGIVTTLTGTSDERLKTDIAPFERGLKDVLKIQPILYRWNEKGIEITRLKPDQEFAGFGAQNIQKAIPEAVSPEGEYLALSDRPIIAALVNAVKELSARVEELEALLKSRK
jgi:hypothetical protein